MVELREGERLIATSTPTPLELEVPAPVSVAAATAAAIHYPGFRTMPDSGCFVCGPARTDGLRVFPGKLVHQSLECVAAPWQPDGSLAGTRNAVRPEFLWAALDCPGYFAASPDARPMLLGSIHCRIDDPLGIDEPCVIVGWSLGASGRKHRAATALYGVGGRPVARAIATWIELKPRG